MSKKYTFREITEKNELEEFFRLRYEVYSNCKRMKPFVKKNEDSLDIDFYDAHSRHYSLSYNNVNVGYFRVVFPKDEFIQNSVMKIAEKHNTISEYQCDLTNCAEPLPFLSHQGVPQSYWDYYKNALCSDKKLAECSRLIIVPDFRNIRTSKFLIECAIVLFLIICLGQMYAVLSCNIAHKRFYEYYGFKIIGHENSYSSHGQSNVAMGLSTLPMHLQSKFEDMTNEYKTEGKIERTF